LDVNMSTTQKNLFKNEKRNSDLSCPTLRPLLGKDSTVYSQELYVKNRRNWNGITNTNY
jgi:hypothetical protein